MQSRSGLHYGLWRAKQFLLSIVWTLRVLPKFRRTLEEDHGITDLEIFRMWAWHSGNRYLQGRHTARNRRVFIKTSSDPSKIVREVHTLQHIADTTATEHAPDIVTYAHDGRSLAFLALGVVPGEPLSDLLERGMSKGLKRELLKQLVDIRNLLQQLDIIHRDIHPRNLLVRPKVHADDAAHLVLIDFAFALRVTEATPLASDQPAEDLKLLEVLGDGFNPRPFVWDDAYAICRIAELIEPDLQTVCSELWRDLTSHVGTLVYRVYPTQPTGSAPR